MTDPAQKLATARDLVALGDTHAEVIHGTIVYKAEPSAEHGDTQLALGAFLRQHFHRSSNRGGPGGWWILTEVDIELSAHQIFRPDVSGWRRDRLPQRPSGRPVGLRPDWICEVLSESNAAVDQVDKFRIYASHGVPFYWIADPGRKILTVYRLANTEYAVALQVKAGETVHAPPFEAVALSVGMLFGDESD